MEEHRNMMILKQEIFDSFIYSAVALTRQIQAKQGKEDEIITQEEAESIIFPIADFSFIMAKLSTDVHTVRFWRCSH
ncbi:hypothetical protein LC766_23655, partial [Bacillus licheniformis]|nr:hypothetical protein [Bacillus licheniformis]